MTRTPPVKRPSLLLPLFRLAAVSVLAALMLWIILSDPDCWRQLWPNDIQAGLLHWTGGQLRTDAADRVHSEPSFAGLLLAVGLPLVMAAVMQRTSQAGAGVAELSRRTLPCVIFAGVWLLLWLVSPLFLGVNFTQFLCTTAAFSMALLLALLWNALPVPAERGGAEVAGTGGPATVVAGSRRSLLVVLLAAVLWQSASFLLNRSLYDNLLVPHGDSAMYEEHLWNTWHGKGFRSYLDQGLFLGEHIQVVHLLLLPLHMLWPHYLLLEWLSTACLAICVVPIFSMARRWSGSAQAALWLALAWLLYFPMHYLDIAIDLKTLRPSCYGLPALFWGIDLAERRRLKSAGVCFLIALLTQEDFALITGGIGLVLWVLRWRTAELDQRAIARWSAGLAVASAAWVLLAVLVVIPAFRGGEVVHYSRYFGDLGSSPGDLLKTALTQPAKVAAILFSQRTLLYVLVLSVPLALLPLRRPLVLLAGGATFAMLSLIQLGNGPAAAGQAVELPPVPYHHFHAPLLPVIFWAAAAGLQERLSGDRRRTLAERAGLPQSPADRARLACLCAALTAVSGSLLPCGAAFWSNQADWGRARLYQPNDRAEKLQRVLARIPPTARVASTDYVHTRLTHYERSYDYSDYLRAVNNYRPGVPADTDYIIIDTGHRYSTIRRPQDIRELREEPATWELLPDETDGMFLVLRRVRAAAN